MADIKKITLPSGTTYDLRDSRVDSIISQGTRWVGVTTTERGFTIKNECFKHNQEVTTNET